MIYYTKNRAPRIVVDYPNFQIRLCVLCTIRLHTAFTKRHILRDYSNLLENQFFAVFIVSAMRFFTVSTLLMWTCTTSPTDSTSLGCLI